MMDYGWLAEQPHASTHHWLAKKKLHNRVWLAGLADTVLAGEGLDWEQIGRGEWPEFGLVTTGCGVTWCRGCLSAWKMSPCLEGVFLPGGGLPAWKVSLCLGVSLLSLPGSLPSAPVLPTPLAPPPPAIRPASPTLLLTKGGTPHTSLTHLLPHSTQHKRNCTGPFYKFTHMIYQTSLNTSSI